MSGLAFPLLVLALTHSPVKAGIVGFANALPNLFLHLPAGPLVDRWDRKRIMLVSDALRAVALGSVAIALWAHTLTFAQIVLVAGTTFGHAALALALIVRARNLGASSTLIGAMFAVSGAVATPWTFAMARSTFLVLGAVVTVVTLAAVSARVIRQAATLEVAPA